MAVRSATAMLIPMLEFQARQFIDGGLHHAKIDASRALYAEIQRRLNEQQESASQQQTVADPNAFLPTTGSWDQGEGAGAGGTNAAGRKHSNDRTHANNNQNNNDYGESVDYVDSEEEGGEGDD